MGGQHVVKDSGSEDDRIDVRAKVVYVLALVTTMTTPLRLCRQSFFF